MAKLLYTSLTSLDGYVADEEGKFGWAQPDEEVHSYVNELSRPIGTHLLGRRMYEVLRFWDDPDLTDEPPPIHEYARIWKGADKVVYSSTLESVSAARTRLERAFDPEEIRRVMESAEADLSIGGPTLAAEALRAGLVDEVDQFLFPVVVGGGTAWLPSGLRLQLELLDCNRFESGVVHVHYRVAD